MIVYNTTFHVMPNRADDFVNWLHLRYIKAAIASGVMHTPRLLHVMPHHGIDEHEGISYSLQLECADIQQLCIWQKSIGEDLSQELILKFKNQVVGFSTTLEQITY